MNLKQKLRALPGIENGNERMGRKRYLAFMGLYTLIAGPLFFGFMYLNEMLSGARGNIGLMALIIKLVAGAVFLGWALTVFFRLLGTRFQDAGIPGWVSVILWIIPVITVFLPLAGLLLPVSKKENKWGKPSVDELDQWWMKPALVVGIVVTVGLPIGIGYILFTQPIGLLLMLMMYR